MDEKEREGETNKQTLTCTACYPRGSPQGGICRRHQKKNANQNVACLISLQNGGNSLKAVFGSEIL